MFGLWNSNLTPAQPDEIGHDYICSTAVVAALYYAGLELDAVRNWGYLDLCSPKQVVSSRGRILPPPKARLESSAEWTSHTISLQQAGDGF